MADWIIGGVIFAAVIFVVIRMVLKAKKGKPVCGCDGCSGCPGKSSGEDCPSCR